MKYVLVATLQRGAVNPPEPVSAEDERLINARVEQEAYFARQERDPPLSQWRGRMAALNMRKPVQRVRSVRYYAEQIAKGSV